MSHNYSVEYPDGSRTKIGREQMREMVREGLLFHVERNCFRYTGHAFVFRNLSDLRLFKAVIGTTKFVGHYPGIFIWMLCGRKLKELLESPDALVKRLALK